MYLHLDRGRGHQTRLVEVQGHDVREATGVAVDAGGRVPESLQNSVDRLPLLRCGRPEREREEVITAVSIIQRQTL